MARNIGTNPIFPQLILENLEWGKTRLSCHDAEVKKCKISIIQHIAQGTRNKGREQYGEPPKAESKISASILRNSLFKSRVVEIKPINRKSFTFLIVCSCVGRN